MRGSAAIRRMGGTAATRVELPGRLPYFIRSEDNETRRG